MTASCTVPFLMVPSGDASLTVTLIRSPRLAIFRVEPPMGMIISTRRAPELSATSSEVCIWITVVTSDYARSLLRSLLNYLYHPQTLSRQKWTRVDDPPFVADGRAELIVGHELRRATHVTTIFAVKDQ